MGVLRRFYCRNRCFADARMIQYCLMLLGVSKLVGFFVTKARPTLAEL
jgi:hypothetical protein